MFSVAARKACGSAPGLRVFAGTCARRLAQFSIWTNGTAARIMESANCRWRPNDGKRPESGGNWKIEELWTNTPNQRQRR